MAWSAPASPYFATLEIPSAAKLNVITDDLRFLKGLDGDIFLEDDLGIGTATPQGNIPAGIARALTVSSGGVAATNAAQFVEGTRSGADASIGQIGFINTAATGTDKRTAFFLGGRENDDNSGNLRIFLRNAGALTEAARFDRAGNFGIGATAPSGKLHVLGAGAIAGAGHVIGSVAAVTSIQTVFPAGTVARTALFLIMDRDNTGPTLGGPNPTQCNVGSSFTYLNTDTITVAVTAGGAVTVQRTTGTHGSHDITIFAIFN